MTKTIKSEWLYFADCAIVQPEAPGQRSLMQNAFYTAFLAGLNAADAAHKELSEMDRQRLFQAFYQEGIQFVRDDSNDSTAPRTQI
jgi:hypothetical protein